MRLSTLTALLSAATATAATAVRRSESDSHPTPTPTPTGSGSDAISSSGSSHGTPPPAPTQAGVVADCNDWYVAQAGDRCDAVLRRYVDLDMPRFVGWNPAVGDDCHGLWASYAYCVGTPEHPARPVDPTACTTSHPQPTQPGALCQCKKWRFLRSGDTCWGISHEENITENDILNWNPGTRCNNLWANYYLCVGI